MASAFRMGRLDHVHLVVPDREVAARWYAEHLGFADVPAYRFWAEGIDGGPRQISADGGRTTVALFEASAGHPMVANGTGVAFSVDAENFLAFAAALPGELATVAGAPLNVTDLVDFDLCWAFDFCDPWGNRLELNCYDYARIQSELVEAQGLAPVRYWPREAYAAYRAGASDGKEPT